MERTGVTAEPFFSATLGKRMLIGAAIGFAVISFFVFGADDPNPEWGKYWRIRPLAITPLAGAGAGLFYHFMGLLRHQGGWVSIVGWIISILGYTATLWVGIVLGLDGTMWD
ncbi:MAG: hypothetical protein K0R82_3021 [Flavipsychrobacter sp.]|nr:hypothetical protein [Flavipsychrobacter sp.]